jgi:glycosyltransferase involved in cell wall biosynthesis
MKLIRKELISFKGFVWVSNDTNIMKTVFGINSRSFKTFMEISEYPDIHMFNKGNFLQRFQANKKQSYFNKVAWSNLDVLALMTNTLLEYYGGFVDPKPALIHLPMTVDLERFSNPIPNSLELKKPYLAFVGNMDNSKDGVDVLINSFHLISNKFKDFNLYLIGSWNYDTPLHLDLIKDLKLEDRVFWMGEFPRDIIPSILTNASLLVMPRPQSKQAQGGFPTKLGEYLASSVPVCATTVGEIPDYLEDNFSVFFAKPGSVNSFANAMERALANPELSKKVGLEGRKVAEQQFNKDIQAKMLYDFLKTI